MENEYLRLVKHHVMDEFDDGKNYITVREIIGVIAESNYNEEMGQSEFDYYLNTLQRVDPLKSFQDDWSYGLFQEAMFMLIRNNPKCEAILHYIADHKNVKIAEDDIIDVSSCYESLAFKLIKQGADIHYHDPNGLNSLHMAAYAGFTDLVKYLLKCKVDPNCLCPKAWNALHWACYVGNSEIVELITQSDVKLYSAQEPCIETALGYAIADEKFDLALLILKSKLANDLEFDQIYDIFCTVCNNELEVVDSMDLPFFELICAKLIQSFSSSTKSNSQRQPILSIYLNNIILRSKKWSIAMKILLTSTIAVELLDEFAVLEEEGIFGVLMAKFDKAGVERENRMEIIKLLLSLDVKPSLNDIGKALLYFKCEMEFEILSLSLPEDYLQNSDIEENPIQYVASVFCGLRDQLDFQKLKNLDRKFYDRVTQYHTTTSFIDDDNTKTPNVLSLGELSRNAARKFVTEKAVILLPKDFRDFVNSLKIPIKVKHFLMLKMPLNEF